MSGWWSVPPEWKGEHCYIVAGGTSVAGQNTEALLGRHVIAVNSSWQRVSFADVLFFGDTRWWHHYGADVIASGFAGIIATSCGLQHSRVVGLRKMQPPGLASDPCAVVMNRTSLVAAINIAVHYGVSSIVLLGADGKPSEDGRTHHHDRHPWDQRTLCWDEQRDDLATLVKPLRDRGIEVVNASPGSALNLWPIVRLESYLL